ncbi:MAG: hypothetical protein ABIA75_13355, partial [Candidatus Neomarinimicrobiota bacterium]
MTAPIARHLRNFRRAALKTDLQALAWFGYSLVLTTVLFALLTESVFYLSPALRFGVWKASLFLLLIAVAAGLVLALLIVLNRIKRYRQTVLARKIGGLVFPKTDTVINALQLERTLGGSSAPALSRAFIDQVDQTLQALDPDAVFPRRQLQRWKLTTLLLQIGFILTLFLFWIPTTSAIYRWAHPRSEFPVPKPFHLLSHSQDISILGGENIEISIQSIGANPDSVTLELIPTTVLAGDTNLARTAPVLHRVAAQSPGVYVLNLTEVYQDYRYRAFVPARYFWQSWKEVSSATHRISVTDRPAFVDFTITVIPPRYTGLKASSQKGNQASVQGLRGSTVSLNLTANRPLSGGFLSLNDKSVPLTVRGRRAEGQFNLRTDGIFSVHISDRRGIANREPIKYHLQMIPDLPPDLKVIRPAPVVELGEDQILPLHLSISDDFGFSKLQVGYEVRRPAFAAAEPYTAIFAISEIAPAAPSQEVFSIWDLTDLDLFPEDEVHYHFELYDNDDVSGPKKSVSANFIARLPSLADLFEKLEQGEADLSQELELEADDLEILNNKLEQAQLELLKREDINWEQQQALRESLEEAREKVEQMKNFSEALDQLAESAEKHGLFSEDMLEKFRQLKELIAELISPELLASMDRLSEALDQLDPQELLSAMEQLSANLNQMEQQLDRFLAIFERIRAEQKMEEVRERLEQLVEQQAGLDEKIQRAGPETEPSDLARMAQEEQRNSEEFDHIRGVMEQAADAVEKFSPPLAAELDQLRQSELAENADEALKNAGNSLRQQQPA